MVRVKGADGGYFHEPPYTWDEEQDFYRRVGRGPEVVLHTPAAQKRLKPKRSKPLPPEK
jgi:hypothetical protein